MPGCSRLDQTFIFSRKYRTGNVNKIAVRSQATNAMINDLLLPEYIGIQLLTGEKMQLLRGTGPGAASGAGHITEDQIKFLREGRTGCEISHRSLLQGNTRRLKTLLQIEKNIFSTICYRYICRTLQAVMQEN